MKLILSKTQKDRMGDVIAIVWLLHRIDDLPAIKNEHNIIIKELWKEYFNQIERHIIGSNYSRRIIKIKDSFDFPFEKDYETLTTED